MRLQKRKLIKVNYEPSLKASRMRAYVEPILKLLAECRNIDNLKDLGIINNLMHISVNIIISIARIIVLTDLSNKNESKLLVK